MTISPNSFSDALSIQCRSSAARLIPPKCTSSQMSPRGHHVTRPPATLLWPFFHSSVIGHTSSDSRKPVDSLPTPSRRVAERVRMRQWNLGESPTRLSGSPLRASCQSLCR